MRTMGILLAGAALLAGSGGGAGAVAPQRGWAEAAGAMHLAPAGMPQSHDDARDRFLIQELLSRWAMGYDEARLDVIGSLFTSDADFVIRLASPKPMVEARGRDAIVKSVASASSQQGDQRRHLVTNFVIDQMTGSTATLTAYAIVVVPGDPNVVGSTVVYSANCQKQKDGSWRFTHLSLAMDSYSGEAPKVGSSQ